MVGQKDDIRRAARARRRGLDAGQREQRAPRMWAYVLEVLPPRTHRVALYAAVGSEVPTRGLFELLRARGCEVVFPRCVAERRLELAPVTRFEDLRPGPHGIPEPSGAPVPLSTVQVLVIPGLAFDAMGTRLGAGAGYYDRTLVGYRGLRLGLAFDCQRVPRLPVAAHDQPMDAVITETGVWWAEAAAVASAGGER